MKSTYVSLSEQIDKEKYGVYTPQKNEILSFTTNWEELPLHCVKKKCRIEREVLHDLTMHVESKGLDLRS